MRVGAVVAKDAAVSRPRHARKLGHVSVGVSVSGIVVSVIIVIVVVSIATSNRDSCSYHYYGGS